MNKSLITTITTGFRHDDKPVITEEYVEEDNGSIKKTVKTGYDTDETDVPPKEIPSIDVAEVTFEESVKDTIDTGFGTGTFHKECSEPELVQYLNKGNHLSEFKTETDKTLARENLGVYSSDKIDQLLKSITNNVSSIYVTKSEVQSMIGDIKLVDSTLKAYANYEVPSNLFRL